MAITLNINDRAVQVPDGSSVLDAINTSGTYISQLCKDPDMKAIGACRTCLVEIDGVRGYPGIVRSSSEPRECVSPPRVWTYEIYARMSLNSPSR